MNDAGNMLDWKFYTLLIISGQYVSVLSDCHSLEEVIQAAIELIGGEGHKVMIVNSMRLPNADYDHLADNNLCTIVL
jgi:3-oxoacyl-(acyl-carrier-protein) synthase